MTISTLIRLLEATQSVAEPDAQISIEMTVGTDEFHTARIIGVRMIETDGKVEVTIL